MCQAFKRSTAEATYRGGLSDRQKHHVLAESNFIPANHLGVNNNMMKLMDVPTPLVSFISDRSLELRRVVGREQSVNVRVGAVVVTHEHGAKPTKMAR